MLKILTFFIRRELGAKNSVAKKAVKQPTTSTFLINVNGLLILYSKFKVTNPVRATATILKNS